MPKNQFDRYATSYSKNRDIQNKIATTLLQNIPSLDGKKIIDIGCGDGAIYEKSNFKNGLFVAVDASPKMCELHKAKGDAVVVQADFDDERFADYILSRFGKFDILISSSSLQWSRDIKKTIGRLSAISDNFAFAVFTRGTFLSVREFLQIESFLPTSQLVRESVNGFWRNNIWSENFYRDFDSPKDAIRYIKNTGVSGGRAKTSYGDTKRLYEFGPRRLEFEVTYAVGSFSKRDFSTS